MRSVLLLLLLGAGTAFPWQQGPRLHRVTGLLVGLDPADPSGFVVVGLGHEPAVTPDGCDTPRLVELPLDASGVLEIAFEHRCPLDRTEILDNWPVRACTSTRATPGRVTRIVLRGERNHLVMEEPPRVPGQAAFVATDIAGWPGRRSHTYSDLIRFATTPGRSDPGWPPCLERLPVLRLEAAREKALLSATAMESNQVAPKP